MLRLSPLLFVLAVPFVFGCEGNESPTEGEGEESEGEEGEGEEGEGEGEGEDTCTQTGCPALQSCGSIFAGDVVPACFNTCVDGAAPCTTAAGKVGECRTLPAFDDAICRSQAENLETCGNVENAGCLDDDAVCVPFADEVIFPDDQGICVRPCDVDVDCLDAALGCSLDLLFLVAGDTSAHGVCAPLSLVGSPCGRLGDGSLELCTSEQGCDRLEQESQGACVE